MTFVHPKSLQNDLKRLQNAYSTPSSHASTILSVLHDHLCKMLIAAPPGIGFFAYRDLFDSNMTTEMQKKFHFYSAVISTLIFFLFFSFLPFQKCCFQLKI